MSVTQKKHGKLTLAGAMNIFNAQGGLFCEDARFGISKPFHDTRL
jgi:hypothetical protein